MHNITQLFEKKQDLYINTRDESTDNLAESESCKLKIRYNRKTAANNIKAAEIYVTLKYLSNYNFTNFGINLLVTWSDSLILFTIQDVPFRGSSWIGKGVKRPPIPKICQTYPATKEIRTVKPYLEKIKKTYKTRDTPLEFC